MVQAVTTLPEGATAGAANIKVAGVAEFVPGQTVTIGNGPLAETAVITTIGTAGSTRLTAATQIGDTVVPVAATGGFAVGQSVTIDSGTSEETVTITQVQGGRGGARITVAMPLRVAHAAGAPLAGSGITLSAPLARTHARGTNVAAELPTPGAANRYSPRAAR
jgi:hypothetical protein